MPRYASHQSRPRLAFSTIDTAACDPRSLFSWLFSLLFLPSLFCWLALRATAQPCNIVATHRGSIPGAIVLLYGYVLVLQILYHAVRASLRANSLFQRACGLHQYRFRRRHISHMRVDRFRRLARNDVRTVLIHGTGPHAIPLAVYASTTVDDMVNVLRQRQLVPSGPFPHTIYFGSSLTPLAKSITMKELGAGSLSAFHLRVHMRGGTIQDPPPRYLFDGHTATVRHAPMQQRSTVSLQYASAILGLTSSLGASIDVSVDIATAEGPWKYYTLAPFSFEVAANLTADIVFGTDWIGHCRAISDAGMISFALETYEGTDVRRYRGCSSNGLPSPTYSMADILQDTAMTNVFHDSASIEAEFVVGSSTSVLSYKTTVPSTSVQNTGPIPVPRSILSTSTSTSNCNEHAVMQKCFPSGDSDNSFVQLSPEEKTEVVTFLVNKRRLNIRILGSLCPFHSGMERRDKVQKKDKSRDVLRAEFLAHRCTDTCLVKHSDADLCGFHGRRLLSETEVNECNVLLKRRPVMSKRAGKRKAEQPVETIKGIAPSRKRQRTEASSCESDPETWSQEFPIVLPQSEKDEIIREFCESTNNAALKRYECSFCGILDSASSIKTYPVGSLDISLLQAAVEKLREITKQPRIQCFKDSSLLRECFVVCHQCNSEISRSKFKSIPVRSYANGLWIGEVPKALQNLTFLEEQCIARARATKCMYKLSVGSHGQFAARGNVCILPQNTAAFPSAMPPPLSVLRDEICVILVGSPDTEITADTLRRSPLLVRRQVILDALLWLIENNPLYADLDPDIVRENVKEYPSNGCPLPITDFLRTNSANNQGSSYTNEANAEQFEDRVTVDDDNSTGLTGTSLIDADNVEMTFHQRKMDALKQLKNGDVRFVKFPSGSTPLSTSRSPEVFGKLWPTLFPYGVGMMDNRYERGYKSNGFREIDTPTHVGHLLCLADRRFQKHLSFIFVVANIIQRRKSSFNARLAVNRSWFPAVEQLLKKIDEQSMESYAEKLQNNPFAKPQTEGERAAAEVMRYLHYVAEDIPGSIGDVNVMKQQIRSKIMCDGLPHFFATINPADSSNPIAQVLAGREIDLDKIFDALGSVDEEPRVRAKLLAENPVAGAEFFHLVVSKFFDIILGTKRANRVGVLGKTKGWYAVVEAQVRGSLHLHVLIWIDGAPVSPIEMKEKMNSDEDFKLRLMKWYDDLICQSFPEDSESYTVHSGMPPKYPVLSRPPDPDSVPYLQKRGQYHRDLCETTRLVHKHEATCFKHIPRNIRSLVNEDEDCRFQLPRPLVSETHFDNEGDLVIRCKNGNLNGHNPTVTVCLGCNTDLKQTASQ